jgi:hypothetical protein
MTGLKPITAEELATIQRALGIKLPADFIRFVAVYPLPKLKYLGMDDIDELCGLNVNSLIAFNENLRDTTLNPEGKESWKEHFLGLGSRPSDDAIFYLDLEQKSAVSSVYVLEAGAPCGQLISGNFTRWAESLLNQLAQEDERIRQWHMGQQPKWWQLVKQIFKLS